MNFFAAFVLIIGAASLNAQTPEVPDQIQFAGISLTIRDDAKKEIQKDVNLLTQHAGYFSVKTDRAKMYFPIIEKIFEEEGVPGDFKFLALQESSLVADAVSSSNAVGFWQFKDFTAMEMGLRVDELIDERMNVVSATHGAAKYLAKNNLQFNNWIYTLQSYQMGAGGVKKAISDLQNGAEKMEVTSETYWYVKRFLAHKIAFENSLNGESEMKLIPFKNSVQKSLKDIAKELSVEETVLKDYNKWLKAELIPNDREYTVIVPAGKLNGDFNRLILPPSKNKIAPVAQSEKKADSIFFINGIAAILSHKDESIAQLAERGKIPLNDFMDFNEMESSKPIKQNTYFLLDKKKNTSLTDSHKVKNGDDLWSISQQYGVKFKKLKKYNNQVDPNFLVVNDFIFLNPQRETLPLPSVAHPSEIVLLDNDNTFDWDVKAIGEKANEVQAIQLVLKKDSVNAIFHPEIEQVPSTTETHSVIKGETLYSIASLYNLKITDLLKWNSLNINDPLKLGQILCLKDLKSLISTIDTSEKNQSIDFHDVKSSDTLYSIARQYGVTIRNLMEWNNKKDFTLSPGERLQIHSK